jgi:hypothetical protein
MAWFWVRQVEQRGVVIEGSCWPLFVPPSSRLCLLAPRSHSLDLPALIHAPLALFRTPQPWFVPYPLSYSRTRALLLPLQLCSCVSRCCCCRLAYVHPPTALAADAATAAVAALRHHCCCISRCRRRCCEYASLLLAP